MASSLEFVEYVCGQLSAVGEITYKKMFGEYGIYCDGKIIGLICDNQCFIKKTEAGALAWPGLSEGEPYKGAKPCFVLEELEDRERVGDFIRKTYEELPMPKPKKKKVK